MKQEVIDIKLHLVTPEQCSFQYLVSNIPLIQHEFDMLHIRLHQQSDDEIANLVNELRKNSFPDSKLMIHDRPHLVKELGLSQVQIGIRSPKLEIVKHRFPNLKIGVSVHSLTEAKQVKEAHFLLLGHIYPTESKRQKEPLGISKVKQIIHAVNRPVIAIGGIKPGHLPELSQIGVHGVAVMSGVLGTEHPTEALTTYNRVRWGLDV